MKGRPPTSSMAFGHPGDTPVHAGAEAAGQERQRNVGQSRSTVIAPRRPGAAFPPPATGARRHVDSSHVHMEAIWTQARRPPNSSRGCIGPRYAGVDARERRGVDQPDEPDAAHGGDRQHGEGNQQRAAMAEGEGEGRDEQGQGQHPARTGPISA